jgi:peptidoglycan/LPS O-acetylase OafA/YrhL
VERLTARDKQCEPNEAACRRLPSLTGLRAVAAIAVFLFHVQENLLPRGSIDELLLRVATPGFTGVSFFFVLSGFVLAWSHRDDDTARGFYRRRFARVMPVYWTTLVLAIALGVYQEIDTWGTVVGRALPSVLGVQAWFPWPSVYFGGNPVGWTLSCEFFFYAAFPTLLYVIPARLGRQALAGGAAVALACCPALIWATVGEPNTWLTYVVPVARLPEFVLGVVMARALRSKWRPPLGFPLAVVISMSTYLIAGFWTQLYVLTVISYGLLIASAAYRDLSGRSTPFARPVWRKLGEWSFAFYLVHQLVIRVVAEQLGAFGGGVTASGVVASVLSLAVSAGLAAAVYGSIEAPLERRLRGDKPRPEMLDVSREK